MPRLKITFSEIQKTLPIGENTPTARTLRSRFRCFAIKLGVWTTPMVSGRNTGSSAGL